MFLVIITATGTSFRQPTRVYSFFGFVQKKKIAETKVVDRPVRSRFASSDSRSLRQARRLHQELPR